MGHLALVVYHWGGREQNELLVKCIGPAVHDLWKMKLINKFWFDRFDARGPHLYFLFGSSPLNRRAVEDHLTVRLNAHLAAAPSMLHLSQENLAEIHQGCQGKSLCEVDRLPGMGTNNTYIFFDHPEDGYPLRFVRLGRKTEELWYGLSALSGWSVSELMNHNTASLHSSALHFVHAVNRELQNDREWAILFWRYAASRLLFILKDERFANPKTCTEKLPSWIGRHNMEVFGMAWNSLNLRNTLFPALPSLVALTQSEVDQNHFSEFAFLREVVHCGLAQLGLPVHLRAPLLVFSLVQNISWPIATLGHGD